MTEAKFLVQLETQLSDSLCNVSQPSFYVTINIAVLANMGGFIIKCVEENIDVKTAKIAS